MPIGVGTGLAIAAIGAGAQTAGTIYAAKKQAGAAKDAAKTQQASNTAALDWEKESYKTEQAQYAEERQRKWEQEDVDRKTAEEERQRRIAQDERDFQFGTSKWGDEFGLEKEQWAQKKAWEEQDRQLAAVDKERRLRQLAPYVEFNANKLATLESLLRPGSGVDLHMQHAVPPSWAGTDLATAAAPQAVNQTAGYDVAAWNALPPEEKAKYLAQGGAPTPPPPSPWMPSGQRMIA